MSLINMNDKNTFFFKIKLDKGNLLCPLVISVVVWVIIVAVVSATFEIKLIWHTFHPIDFSPGFASSINLQFSVEQSHDALQTGASLDVLPVNSKTIISKMRQIHVTGI